MESKNIYPPHFEGAAAEDKINFGVLTVSDRCFRKETADFSGPALEKLIKECKSFSGDVVVQYCVPDEIQEIKDALINMSDELQLDVVITTGGTGFAPRDVTPEATTQVIEKQAPGLMTAMTLNSLSYTAYAMLSRAVCGIRKRTVIINLPGSPKAVKECFDIFSPVLKHAVQLLDTSCEPKKYGKRSKILNSDKSDEDIHTKRHEIIGAPFLQSKILKQSLASSSLEHFDKLLCEGSISLETMAQESSSVSSVKTDNVAGRPRKSEYPLFTVDEALRCISKLARPIGIVQKSVKNDALEQVLGYVLAEDICATEPHPPFPASIKDGYAVIASDGTGTRKVIDNSIAGSNPNGMIVKSGTCIRVNTGAPVPNGADAVIQVEDTKLISNSKGEEVEVDILKKSSVGQDIRKVGSDIKKGQVVVPKKSVIGAGELGAAATVGNVQFKVYDKPKISVLTTGNEIVEPSVIPKPGQIRNSNKVELLSLFKSKGYCVFDSKTASDNPDDILKHVNEMLSISDVLIITGGMSMGEKDYIKEVLKQDLHVDIHFGRVFMKPGKPTMFGTVTHNSKRKVIFGLPGNPVSALVTAQLFVLPALLSMSGHDKTSPNVVKAKIQLSKKLDERPEYMRAHLQWNEDDAMPIVTHTTPLQISSNVCSLVGANALISLPPAQSKEDKVVEGSVVNVLYMGHV